jgi:Fur family transcriptional regulator, zinc uptake regulator
MSFPTPHHDHSRCTSALVEQAETKCAQLRVRLTEQRREVLTCVAESHAAVGAYDIIERMAQNGPRPAPITVYRALDFLQSHNLVHKIECRNAYVACSENHADAPAALLICDSCGNVSEVVEASAVASLMQAALHQGFAIKRAVVELTGTCAHCAA